MESKRNFEEGKEFDVLLDVMDDILNTIRELPYRINEFGRDDKFYKECPSCKKNVAKLRGGRFCPYCGKAVFSDDEIEMNLRVCFKCDQLFNFYFSHCPYCGNGLVVLPDNIHVNMMTTIYEGMEGASSLEDGLFLDEIPSKGIVDKIRGLIRQKEMTF